MQALINIYKRGRTFIPNDKKPTNIAFLLVLLATSMDNLNISGTMASYFSIIEHFDSTPSTASWVLSAYSLTLGAFIIIGGKLADVFGPENVFIHGTLSMSLFALLTAVVDQSIIGLIVLRAFQGVAGACLIPCAFAFVGGFYPKEKLAGATGLLLLALTASMGVGLVVGGAFAETNIGYRGMFYFTFAMSFVVAIGLFFLAPNVPRTEEHSRMKFKNLDFGGAAFLVCGLLLIILGLTEGGEGWSRPVAYVPIPIGVLVVIAVILYETVYLQRYKLKSSSGTIESQDNTVKKDWRAEVEPMFPVEVAKIRNFPQYFFSICLAYSAFIVVISLKVQYHLYVDLNSSILAGVKLLPLAAGLVFGATVFRWKRYAQVMTSRIGLMLSPVLSLGFAVWLYKYDFRVKDTYWKFEFVTLFVFGYGGNLFFQVYYHEVISGTPKHLQGVVSGILQTSGQVGICLGNAATATIVGEIYRTHDFDTRVEFHDKLVKCFYLVFACYAVMILILATVKFGGQEEETSKNDLHSNNDPATGEQAEEKVDDTNKSWRSTCDSSSS